MRLAVLLVLVCAAAALSVEEHRSAVQSAISRLDMTTAQRDAIRGAFDGNCNPSAVQVPITLPALPSCGTGCNPELLLSPAERQARRIEAVEQRARVLKLFERECIHRTIENAQQKLRVLESRADQIRSRFLTLESKKSDVLRTLHKDKKGLRVIEKKERASLSQVQSELQKRVRAEAKRDLKAEKRAKKDKAEAVKKMQEHLKKVQEVAKARAQEELKAVKEEAEKNKEQHKSALKAASEAAKASVEFEKQNKLAEQAERKQELAEAKEEHKKAILRAKARRALAKAALDESRAEKSAEKTSAKSIVKKNTKFVKGVNKLVAEAKKDFKILSRAMKGKAGNMSAWQKKRREEMLKDPVRAKVKASKKNRGAVGSEEPFIVSKLAKPDGRKIATPAKKTKPVTPDIVGKPPAAKKPAAKDAPKKDKPKRARRGGARRGGSKKASKKASGKAASKGKTGKASKASKGGKGKASKGSKKGKKDKKPRFLAVTPTYVGTLDNSGTAAGEIIAESLN